MQSDQRLANFQTQRVMWALKMLDQKFLRECMQDGEMLADLLLR